MKRPDNIQRYYLDQISRLTENENNELLRLLGISYLHSSTDEEITETVDENKVGIWNKKSAHSDAKYLIDEKYMDEFNFWAKTAALEPKGTKKRILLIGESAARGYFYDPVYNLSIELNAILDRCAQEEYEIIDLARTDLNYEMLLQLLKESVNLSPDIVIVFAGNNWDVHDIWEKQNLAVGRIISQGNINDLYDYCNQQLKNKADQMYDLLKRLFVSKGISVITVIPEFNAGHWSDSQFTYNWLMDGQCEYWNSIIKQVKQLKAAEDYKSCIEILEQDQLLESYTGTELWYLLAEAYAHTGNLKKVGRIYNKIKNLAMIYPQMTTPRAFSIVQDTLKDLTEKDEGIACLDMRALFAEASDKDQNFSYFMDYCHLSSKGIQLLMGKVAEIILTGDDKLEKECILDEKVEAEAHLLAAIHNAHWGQSEAIIKYHLETAIKEWPQIKTTMKQFIDFQSRNLLVWMSGRAEKYIESVSEQRQRYVTNNKGLMLDLKLIDQIGEVLQEKDLTDYIETLRNEVYGLDKEPINLLHSDYYVSALSQREAQYNGPSVPEKLKRYGYLRAYSETTDFVFSIFQPENIKLKLTYRTGGRGEIKVLVNGTVIQHLEAASEWTVNEISVDKKVLIKGINRLKIVWPEVNEMVDDKKRDILNDLEKGLIPEIIPVFGKIHSLKLYTSV